MRALIGGVSLVGLSLPVLATPAPEIEYVATAHQAGPVAHRDPVGALSPDGAWLAFSEGRFLRLRRVDGGPVIDLPALERDIRHIAWLPDSRQLAVRDRGFATDPPRWFRYDVETGAQHPLWSEVETISSGGVSVTLGDLQNLVWSADGRRVAGTAPTSEGGSLWILDADGRNPTVRTSRHRLSFPAFRPGSETIACLAYDGERQRLDLACDSESPRYLPGQEVYGPVAFSPDGGTVYYASPDEAGIFVDLWSRHLVDGERKKLTSFARDAHAPSADAHGRVLFKVQEYRLVIARAPADGGRTEALTTFLAETPSFDFTGERIAFTYGNWRRARDDFEYPDISQHVGWIRLDAPLPASAPEGIVSASLSEDQGQSFSPNGKWIAYHSHYGPSDDVWIVPADRAEAPRRLTDGGHETGWPRWSPDGRYIVYGTQKGSDASARLYVLGVSQDTGRIVRPEREVPLEEFEGEVIHAEWTPGSEDLLFEAYLEPGRKAIYRVGREGGRPRLVHEFASEDKHSGIGVSKDGSWIAYVAPGAGGYQQVYRVPSSGGEARAVTTDSGNKTHPTISPDGRHVAFTLWSYASRFFLLTP